MRLLERLAEHYDEMSRDDWRDEEGKIRLEAKRDGVRTAARVLASLDSR